jgi:type II restriction enzyme
MENIIGSLLTPICEEHDILMIKQATAAKILNQWNINIEVDKTSRKFDFAVNRNGALFFIETNYYSGGGSKLKSTAGEYISLSDYIAKQGHNFIWITDGQGWKSTLRPLYETFNRIDYTLNIKMVLDGVLEYILTE